MFIILSLIPNLWQFIVLFVWMIASIGIAPLVQHYIMQMEAYIIYPFVCVKCTTFWTNLIPCILLAYLWTWQFVIWGLITASVLAYIIYYSNKH